MTMIIEQGLSKAWLCRAALPSRVGDASSSWNGGRGGVHCDWLILVEGQESSSLLGGCAWRCPLPVKLRILPAAGAVLSMATLSCVRPAPHQNAGLVGRISI